MTRWPIERFSLTNGLRVVLSPDRGVAPGAGVVGVAVVYDVGSRSEPADRSGFAHLFEHLAFQGSRHFPKSAHSELVQGVGGSFNGATRSDHTEYQQVVPSEGLGTVLELEADRMRGLVLTEENLRNQTDVVAEEIRTNVLSKPYGGFPWVWLSPILFDTFANAHDGYGSFEDLRAATLADAADFAARYYTPANAVLCVTGDFVVADAEALIRKHFEDIPAGEGSALPDFTEPELTASRRGRWRDPLAPLPAAAVGWRVSSPADLRTYLPFLVLASVLRAGDCGRLQDRLVHETGLSLEVTATVGLGGDPFAVRAPAAFVLSSILTPGADVDAVLSVADEELDRIGTGGLTGDELDRVRLGAVTKLLRSGEAVANRAVRMAVLEQQRGDAGLLARLPELIGEVSPADVAAAAAALSTAHRAVLEVTPG